MDDYVLSKPNMYFDDLKIFSESVKKSYPALQSTKACMEDLDMEWNAKKCAVMNVKRDVLDEESHVKFNDSTLLRSVWEKRMFKFLGIQEHLDQDLITIRESETKEFLQRVWLLRSSPLSDALKVQASNTFVMAALAYFMITTDWAVHEYQ